MDVVSLPSTFPDCFLRLLTATAVGAVIGFNRELEGKSAGIRTHALVSLGAGLIVLVGLELSQSSPLGDASATSRLVQGIVAGMGFICGGVILQRGVDVRGLTTAASLWVAAGLGTAAGLGLWRLASAASALAVLVLSASGVDRAIGDWRGRRKGTDRESRTRRV